MMPSHWEFLVIALVILLLFGAKRIPEMARGLGKGIREFRSAVKDVQDEVDLSGHQSSSRPNNTIPPASPPPGQVARDDGQNSASQNTASQPAATGAAAPAPESASRDS
jgi:sec-independent protein translocase protein TatA